MSMQSLNDFRLVGGTALALQIGHRESIDVDLFSEHFKMSYDFEALFDEVKNVFKDEFEVRLKQMNSTGFACNVHKESDAVKLDIYKWPSPFLKPEIVFENIRMAQLDDIIAMKLEAIDSRNNYRDFVDIAFLSEHYTFSEMFELYTKRTLSRDYTRILKALGNPDDLVRNQELSFIKPVNESELKDKVNYMLFVYTQEQEAIRKKRKE